MTSAGLSIHVLAQIQICNPSVGSCFFPHLMLSQHSEFRCITVLFEDLSLYNAKSSLYPLAWLWAFLELSLILSSFLLLIALMRKVARPSSTSSRLHPSCRLEYADQGTSSPCSLPSSLWGLLYLPFLYLDFIVILVAIIAVSRWNSIRLCNLTTPTIKMPKVKRTTLLQKSFSLF